MEYLMITALCFFMYIRILPYDYIIDDQLVPKGKGKNFIHTFWLQLTCRKYCNRYVEHLQRIAVHAIVCCLIYRAFGQTEIAFVAAMLFAVNPVNNNGVAWLNGIGYSVSTACVLAMIMAPVAAGIPYLWSLWWHVTAFPAPFLFLFNGQPLAALWILPYILVIVFTKGKVPFGKVQDNATLDKRIAIKGKLFTQIWLGKFIFVFKTYGYYHWLTLFPVRLGLYHTFGYAFGLTKKDTDHWCIMSPLFFVGILTASAHLWVISHFWGSSLAFGLIWFDLFIAQFCNLLLIQQTITERYCYLPAVGMMMALAWSLYHWLPVDQARLWAVGIGAAYATKLFYYIPAYRDMEKYVDMNIHEFPDQFAAWNWAGVLHREKGRIFSAMYHWAIGLRYQPTSFRLNFNMAMAFKQLGYADQAEQYLERAEQGLPPEVIAEHKATIDKERTEIKIMAGKASPKRMVIPEDWQKKGVPDGNKKIADPFAQDRTKGGIILPRGFKKGGTTL